MKSVKVGMAALLVAIMAAGVSTQAVAQEEEEQYSYGQVVSVSGETFVLREYNEEGSQVEVSYTAGSGVEYYDIAALSDLKPEDYVEVYFKVDNGSNIATYVGKDSYADEDYGYDDELDAADEPAAQE